MYFNVNFIVFFKLIKVNLLVSELHIVKVLSCLLHHSYVYLQDSKRSLKDYCNKKCNYFSMGNKRPKIALLHFGVLVLTGRGKATTNEKQTIRQRRMQYISRLGFFIPDFAFAVSNARISVLQE